MAGTVHVPGSSNDHQLVMDNYEHIQDEYNAFVDDLEAQLVAAAAAVPNPACDPAPDALPGPDDELAAPAGGEPPAPGSPQLDNGSGSDDLPLGAPPSPPSPPVVAAAPYVDVPLVAPPAPAAVNDAGFLPPPGAFVVPPPPVNIQALAPLNRGRTGCSKCRWARFGCGECKLLADINADRYYGPVHATTGKKFVLVYRAP
jgi:hypothetical protein